MICWRPTDTLVGRTTNHTPAAMICYFLAFASLADMILYIPVPQTLHLPRIAGRPFFIVTCSASFISRVCLHLTQ